MPRRRLNWTYDDEKQQFTTPTGRTITLHEIAGLIHDKSECSRHLNFYLHGRNPAHCMPMKFHIAECAP